VANANRTRKENMLPETNVSGAEDFLVVVVTGPELVEVPLALKTTLPVPVAPDLLLLEVVVEFSKNTWGALLAVTNAELVLRLLDASETRLDGLELAAAG
jgi:hypothetical protein